MNAFRFPRIWRDWSLSKGNHACVTSFIYSNNPMIFPKMVVLAGIRVFTPGYDELRTMIVVLVHQKDWTRRIIL